MKKLITLLSLFLLLSTISFAQTFKIAGDFTDWGTNPIIMSKVGDTDVYKLTTTISNIGEHEFKVVVDDSWIDGSNRFFRTTEDNQEVTFYTRKSSEYWYVFCDAQEFYLVGDVVGGWDASKIQLIMNTSEKSYFIGDLTNGEYKLVTLAKNGDIIWSDIMENNFSLDDSQKYQITLDFTSMSVTAQYLGGVFDSYIFTDFTDENKRYSVSDFDGKSLGTFSTTQPLLIGGEISTYPRIFNGMTVKIYYKIDDDSSIKSFDLPWNADINTNDSKWQTGEGELINVSDGLSNGDHTISVWFYVAKLDYKIYDNNGGSYYVAYFSIDNTATSLYSNLINHSIITDGNQIKANFEGSAPIELYTINGTLLKKTVAVDSFEQADLLPGLYIIKINGKANKVLVK